MHNLEELRSKVKKYFQGISPNIFLNTHFSICEHVVLYDIFVTNILFKKFVV